MNKDVETRQVTSPQQEDPFIQWKYTYDEKTKQYQYNGLQLSDGSKIDEQKVKAALKRTTGTQDIVLGEKILKKVASGMSSERHDLRLNDASTLLPALRPRDETEALLLGQFLTLQDSGMKCFRQANLPEQGFYHQEKLFILAQKLMNTANQTIQTLLKYRSGGQQTVQVVHVHNEGQAIVTQNLSAQHGEGAKEKNKN